MQISNASVCLMRVEQAVSIRNCIQMRACNQQRYRASQIVSYNGSICFICKYNFPFILCSSLAIYFAQLSLCMPICVRCDQWNPYFAVIRGSNTNTYCGQMHIIYVHRIDGCRLWLLAGKYIRSCTFFFFAELQVDKITFATLKTYVLHTVVGYANSQRDCIT